MHKTDHDISLLGTAASLLTTLTNPLNTTLLASQLLTAPAIWAKPDGLHTCARVMGVFHSAAITLLKHHHDEREGKVESPLPGQFPIGGGMSLDEWATAVVKGANERSPRWKHLIVIGGLRLGLSGNEDMESPPSLMAKLDNALVKATNLAATEAVQWDELGAHCITLVLNHSFPTLPDFDRSQFDYDKLLPVLVGSAFFSREGLQSAYFLGAVDPEVVQVPGKKLNWPMNSSSFRLFQAMMSSPLMASMGPLSRLISHAVENVQNPWLVQTMVEDLMSFSRTLIRQWRQTKLSQIDQVDEAARLHEEARLTTIPLLWKLLKNTLFAIVIVLRGVMGRVMTDSALAADAVAPVIVSQVLHTLRNLYFISSREGAGSFRQFAFVYLTAIDIITQYPIQADGFLKEIRPSEAGRIPKNPLDRCLDLFFLNTAEHFTLILSPQTNEDLLVAAAGPYLAAGSDRNLLEIFEAAHSVMLAVLSSPRSAEIASKHLPFYIDALFSAFPENLSSRQFRLAFKTLLRVTAPPSPLSATHPELPATLLEMVHFRALHAPIAPLPPESIQRSNVPQIEPVLPLSEQAVLILTLLDALPFLPTYLLNEWLPLCAELVNVVEEPSMRNACRQRFWEVLVSGEMDPERSQMSVTWWTSRGGREQVMYGPQRESTSMMSGALPVEERSNKL
jgi:hypothetical protein